MGLTGAAGSKRVRSGLVRLRAAPRLHRSRRNNWRLVAAKDPRAAFCEWTGSGGHGCVCLSNTFPCLHSFFRSARRRVSGRGRRMDCGTVELDRVRTNSNAFVGTSTGHGRLPAGLHGRSRRRQRRLGFCGSAHRCFDRAIVRGNWFAHWTTSCVAVSSHWQHEFAADAFIALARTNSTDRCRSYGRSGRNYCGISNQSENR